MSVYYVPDILFEQEGLIRMEKIHGGDIYRNHVEIDFSINVNPLGMPKTVEAALHKAVTDSSRYPDISAEKLTMAVSEMVNVPKENLIFGNGASELFMGIIHGINPRKTMIVVPSFYGYEYALKAIDGEVIYYETKEENGFNLEDNLFSSLTEDIDLFFLANPNNPTGNLINREYLKRLLCHCREKGIYVVLDECFVEFCDKKMSVLEETKKFPNLILVRAFTKIFAIPGVRLGYLICSNQSLLEKIGKQLPEWNISSFAQAAGCECATQTAFVKKTVDYIKKERFFLEDGLKKMKIKVYPGNANFLLIYSEHPLYERLLEKGILIRNCDNFKGLSKGFYRIAVKTRKKNEVLLKAIGEIHWEE